VSETSEPAAFLGRLRGNLQKLPVLHLPHFFSRLGARVLLLNLFFIFVIIIVFFATDKSREHLIENRIEAMQIEAELIARSFAGETVVGPESTDISPDAANLMMKMMVTPTDVRARMYSKTGRLISDSKLLGSGQIEEFDLPPIGQGDGVKLMERAYDLWFLLFGQSNLPLYREYANQPGTDFEEVVSAVEGQTSSMRRQNSEGELVVTVAVPIRRFKIVLGVLLVSGKGGDIDQMIRESRIRTLTLLGYGMFGTIFLSLAFSFYIVRPVKRLAAAADEAVTGTNFARVEIPSVKRNDEIGDLSTSFRRMVRALYLRVEAIESFAADVAHEIKNPLTSIRSAVETLGIVKDEKSKEKLLKLIVQDVGRLDRLISDISDASRLDAELVRETSEPIDMAVFLEGLSQIYLSTRGEDDPIVVLSIIRDGKAGDLKARDARALGKRFVVNGIESRFGQVFRNIINNAVSFSEPNDTISVTMARRLYQGQDVVYVTIDDQGPGIPEDNLESIFKRFYTERPSSEDFGGNSGLGLSISRQIVEMFDGKIWAENIKDLDGQEIVGARFVIALPVPRKEDEGGHD
jgi:two-component system, OmpR family, sensor histidine kinase ChvG